MAAKKTKKSVGKTKTLLREMKLVEVKLSLEATKPGLAATGDILRGGEVVDRGVRVSPGAPWPKGEPKKLAPGSYTFAFGTQGKGAFSLGVSLDGNEREQVKKYDTGDDGLSDEYKFGVKS